MQQPVKMTLTKSDIPLHIYKALHFAVLATLPFSTTLNNRIIILLGISMFFLPGIFDEIKATFRNKYFWLFSSPFILVCLGMLYTEDLKYGFGYVERNAMLMVLPFVIFSSRKYLTPKFIKTILFFWAFIITGACVLCHYHVFQKIIADQRPISDLWNYYKFTYSYLSGYINIFPSYLALYICLSLATIGYYLFSNPRSKILILGGSLAFIYLLIFLFLLNSRTQIISAFVVILVISVLVIKNKKFSLLTSVIGIITLAVFLTIFSVFPNLKLRFIEKPKSQIAQMLKGENSTGSFSSRFNLLKCGMETIGFKEWIIGHGTGDAQNELVKCYTAKGDEYLIANQYHIHNEYMNRLTMHGLAGISLIILIFFISIRNAVEKKKLIYGIFLLFIIIAMVPHNILSMHKGVVFFGYFNSIFFLQKNE